MHKSGEIINVSMAKYLGGRIQLPANLVSIPTVSNPHLWDVDAVEGGNQILIKPNSDNKEGQSTMIFAFTDDGQVFDIKAQRVKASKNQPCVLINARQIMSDQQKSSISRFVMSQKPVVDVSPQLNAKIDSLTLQLSEAKKQSKVEKDKAIVEALRKYRYRIYTRYSWDEGDGFIGQDVVSDAYDDGQFTYIRLSNPNRGILSVETEIGGKAAIAPMKYDDAYGMYKVTGIYPKLRLHLDDVTVEVKRTDFSTRGKG
jgi:hypothetical protein